MAEMSETLYRSLDIGEATGRTLSGLAMPWDVPTRVRDLTGPAYMEAFSPSSCDVTIRQHPSFPVFKMHNWRTGGTPLGVVTFSRSAEGAMFDANLSNTREADETLELVNDMAMRSVSVGFKPLQAVRRVLGRSTVDQYRTEVALRELSLCPTGFGQYAEAGVSAVRSDDGTDLDEDPAALMQAVDAALDAATTALVAGELDQGLALVTAAEVSVDALLALFGIVDADDIEGADPMAAAASMRMHGLHALAARKRRTSRLPELPTF